MQPQPRNLTILVIDDEDGPRGSLQLILRAFSTVYTAENGQRALAILSERDVDLVTLDLRLPDFRGADLLREIKKRKPSVEVIIVTGYGTLQSAIDVIRHGAADYVLKPFNLAELFAVLNRVQEKKQRLDAARHLISGLELQDIPCGETQQHDSLRFARVLANTLESRDRFASHRGARVSVYASLLADRLALSAPEREAIELGTFLHDIGKVAIDSRILFKETALTPREFEEIKVHPQLATDLITPLGLSSHVVMAIRHHHERYDGKGYPDGLKGEEVSLAARIIGLVESFDAMVADRPYRKALPLDAVVAELTRCAGTQFDPALVHVLLQIIAERGRSILPDKISPDAVVLQKD